MVFVQSGLVLWVQLNVLLERAGTCPCRALLSDGSVLSMDSSLHLSEYIQGWDCLRQMRDLEGRKLLLKNIFLSQKYRSQCQHVSVCMC